MPKYFSRLNVSRPSDFVAPSLGQSAVGGILTGIATGVQAGAQVKRGQQDAQRREQLARQLRDALIAEGVSEESAGLAALELAAQGTTQLFEGVQKVKELAAKIKGQEATTAQTQVETELMPAESAATVTKDEAQAGLYGAQEADIGPGRITENERIRNEKDKALGRLGLDKGKLKLDRDKADAERLRLADKNRNNKIDTPEEYEALYKSFLDPLIKRVGGDTVGDPETMEEAERTATERTESLVRGRKGMRRSFDDPDSPLFAPKGYTPGDAPTPLGGSSGIPGGTAIPSLEPSGVGGGAPPPQPGVIPSGPGGPPPGGGGDQTQALIEWLNGLPPQQRQGVNWQQLIQDLGGQVDFDQVQRATGITIPR